jgi:hypothetical protein
MPRNSSGTYTLPSGNPVSSGTLIEASWANNTLSDLASAMTDSLSRDGEGGMTAALRLFDGTVSLPGLAFTNETSTGLYRAGAGDMRLAITGSQVMQFLATGVAVTGTLSASGNTTLSGTLAVTGAATFSGTTATFENATAYYPQITNRNKTNDANGSYVILEKVRNTSVVQNGDVLGNLVFRGYDGAAYLQGAYINAIISATPGTNDMPTDLVFGTTPDGGAGPSERMRLDKAGNLLVGTTTPVTGAKLTVSGGMSSSAGLVTSGNGWGVFPYTASSLVVDTNAGTSRLFSIGSDASTKGSFLFYQSTSSGSATQAMTLDASGNLGVGYTAPSQNFTAGILTGVKGYNIVYTGNGTEVASWTANASTGEIKFGAGSSYFPTFWSNGSERARIDSSGNLLVGTTSADIIGANGDGFTYRPASKSFSVNATSSAPVNIGRSTSSGTLVNFFYNAAVKGTISTDGSTTAYNTSSDYRLKEDIQPMTGALAKVAALKPCTYKWKADGSDGEGFIAHELAEVVPQCVTGEKDATSIEQYEISPAVPATFDEEGNELTPAVEAVMGEREVPAYQGIDTSFLVATLTAAIQEQQAIITQMQADIAALKATP